VRGAEVAGDTTFAHTPGLDGAVRAGVQEVRFRNGVAVAWIRVVLRVLTLSLWIATGLRGGGDVYWEAAAANSLHLAVGIAVLLLLLRRLQVDRVLLAAAAVDLLVVAFAGLRTEAGDGASVGYLMGVFELILLLAALTLPRRQVAVLAILATAFQGYLGIRTGVEVPFVMATVLTLGAFSLAAAWAGARMIELATRDALDVFAAQLVGDHRDALARANAEIAAKHDQLALAQQQAAALTQLIVHDLRNPLASIVQFISLAATRAQQHGGLDDLEEDLRLAGEEGQRLAGMVSDLQLVARLESGAMLARPRAAPIRLLLETATRDVEPRARDLRVTVSAVADPNLMARVDLDLVRRLLEILLVHALRDARPGDRVELDAGLVDGELRIVVRSSGPPVPEEARERLFEKHGLDPGQPRRGAGLGLYLCRLIAEAHGGRMVLAEAPGWSVAFEARLPGAAA